MGAPYVLSASFGPVLPEVDKLILPDVFHIDDLLDFSNDDIGGPIVGGPVQLSSGLTVESSVTALEPSICCSSSLEAASTEHTATTTLCEEIDHKTDLCVPCDDLADLEWLSSFVEDSFTMGSTMGDTPELMSQCGGVGFNAFAMANHNVERVSSVVNKECEDPYHKSSPVSVLENSATSSELTGTTDYRDVSVPGRARSKRSRTGARIWTSRILPTSSSVNSFESVGGDGGGGSTESYAMSFSPIASSQEDLSGDTGVDVVEQDGEDSQSSKRSKLTNQNHLQHSHNHHASGPTNKGRKKGQDITQPWRCMHCQTQRTPQWRTGPMGPKTLCNACGVRYKSGRLLPEYRPAGSPTYVAAKHSHSHKKVLEMRRERELRMSQPQNQPQQQHNSSNLQNSHHQTQQAASLPPRDKTASLKNSDYIKVEFPKFGNRPEFDAQTCFSKPIEIPKAAAPKIEALPKFGSVCNSSMLELPRCLIKSEYEIEDSSTCRGRGLGI